MGAQALINNESLQYYNCLIKRLNFCSRVLPGTICNIKLFAGFLSLVDMEGKSIYSYRGFFDYSYGIARPHLKVIRC